MATIFGDSTELFYQAVWLSVMLSAAPLLLSMAAGLVLSVLQAATQIQENSITFVPKLAICTVALFWLGPWMLRELTEYFALLLAQLPHLARSV